jgi:hypothetical protein
VPHVSAPDPAPAFLVFALAIINALIDPDLILFYFVLFHFIFAFHCNLFHFHAKPPFFSLTISIELVFE